MQDTGEGPGGPMTGYRQAALLAGLLVCSTSNGAVENWKTEVASGALHVKGALLVGACGLVMESAAQDIWLGETSTAVLAHTGDAGRSVPFELRLTGCLPVSASSADRRTGNLVWSRNEPAVSISFHALTDPDMPGYILTQGTRGMALRLSDAVGKTQRINERNTPFALSPGNNTLHYMLTPVRTPASLMPGAWRAVIQFGMHYD